MITSKDRSGWFGASDTSYVVGNRDTSSFKKWWLVKLGLMTNDVNTKAMKCGNAFEHKILDCIGCRKDYQVLIPELHLRVNYDGDRDGVIYEVKTHKADKPFKVTAGYFRQAQVEMFAMGTRELYIVSYALTKQEYRNYFTPIEKERICFHKVEYDEKFISEEYLPKLRELCGYLRRGEMPQ